jgi:hypothetical protein
LKIREDNQLHSLENSKGGPVLAKNLKLPKVQGSKARDESPSVFNEP